MTGTWMDIADELRQLSVPIKYYSKQAPHRAARYVKGLFPIAGWLPRYNRTWLYGDILAGLVVGIMVVPQVASTCASDGVTVPLKHEPFTRAWRMRVWPICPESMASILHT
jgi:hypothetical protein